MLFFQENEVLRSVPVLALTAVIAIGAISLGGNAVRAADVAFTDEFMNDPGNIASGKKMWLKQCARCHGKRAYPGKAPKLKPFKYKAEFVYSRITKGFRGMPPWNKKYNKKQRMAITAWIMSKDFEN